MGAICEVYCRHGVIDAAIMRFAVPNSVHFCLNLVILAALHAISALYLKRGNNISTLYALSICVKFAVIVAYV